MTATRDMTVLAEGRKRYNAQRREEAHQRVLEYMRWVRGGCKTFPPPIPSDNDFHIARGEK